MRNVKHLYVAPETHRKIRIRAAEEGLTIRDFLERLLARMDEQKEHAA